MLVRSFPGGSGLIFLRPYRKQGAKELGGVLWKWMISSDELGFCLLFPCKKTRF